MKKHPIIKEVINYIVITAASLIYALGLYSFTVPAQIAPGGVSGFFTAVNYLTGFPIGLATILINIPLLAAGFFVIGKGGGVSSLLLPPIHPHMASPSREKASQSGLVRIWTLTGVPARVRTLRRPKLLHF